MKNILEDLKQNQDLSYSDNFILDEGGMIFGFDPKRPNKIFYEADDIHTLTIGGTRSGKSRCIVLPSIGLMGLAGESMIISDPKGELYQYTYPFLERLGYNVVAVDFRNPRKSQQFNFLQEVIDAVADNDMSLAIEAAFDVANAFVPPSSSGEKIWSDGEKAVLASMILAVVYDNRVSGKYQDITNVYHFIVNMCPMGEHMPLNDYLESIPETHPARAVMKQAEVSPSRTRGSFYTSALATLTLFSTPNIYHITSKNSFTSKNIGREKTALFIILPDEKPTYYTVASLMINQIYIQLVSEADRRGGRLERRVNFILDEFGNFAPIRAFDNKISVGGGRGIRFHLFLQGIAQLEKRENYGPEEAKLIMNNCRNWIYLNSTEMSVLKMISERLGTYTCKSTSQSTSYSTNYMGNTNQSSSYNLGPRELLKPDEISRIVRPDTLILTDKSPAITYAPDISQTVFAKMFGMGTYKDVKASKEHDRCVRLERESRRKVCERIEEIELWGIWNAYTKKKSAAPRTIVYDK